MKTLQHQLQTRGTRNHDHIQAQQHLQHKIFVFGRKVLGLIETHSYTKYFEIWGNDDYASKLRFCLAYKINKCAL